MGTVATLFPAFLLTLALLSVALPKAAGYEWRTVVSGSMSPALQPGDVVLVSPSTREVEVGDIVAFDDPSGLNREILHRVAAITVTGNLVTKGDANDVADPWQINPSQVIGTKYLHIPKIGFLVEAATTKPGIFIFLVLPSLVILVNEARVWYRFVRYGPTVFDTVKAGRHLPKHGKHLAEVPT